MNNKISVITVVYNDVKHIESTIKSYLSQTWANKEYIVIDGGSNDGTAEIIKQYADKIAYWCSEKDEGIYDAMNKGINKASGDWMIILNSGDVFYSPTTLEDVIESVDTKKADIIYGDSIEIDKYQQKIIEASKDISLLEYYPIYRHGSSLIRTAVQRAFPYDLNKQSRLHYALDWEMIYRVYKAGHRFVKANVIIEAYQKEGTSNHTYKNLLYNYRITSQGKCNIKKLWILAKGCMSTVIKNSLIYPWIRSFIIYTLPNDILPLVPFWCLRKLTFGIIGMRIGKMAFIMKDNYFINPNKVSIGAYSHVNRGCLIDGRGKVCIGNNVSISHNVNIITGSHDVNDRHFLGVFKPVSIADYAFLGIGCTVLQGVKIGQGAVVCAGAVVTKDIAPYTIVAGIPAREIGMRNDKLQYHCHGYIPLT